MEIERVTKQYVILKECKKHLLKLRDRKVTPAKHAAVLILLTSIQLTANHLVYEGHTESRHVAAQNT